MDLNIFTNVVTRLSEGFVTTIEIFALTLLIAIPAGLILSLGSMSKIAPIKYAVKFLVYSVVVS